MNSEILESSLFPVMVAKVCVTYMQGIVMLQSQEHRYERASQACGLKADYVRYRLHSCLGTVAPYFSDCRCNWRRSIFLFYLCEQGCGDVSYVWCKCALLWFVSLSCHRRIFILQFAHIAETDLGNRRERKVLRWFRAVRLVCIVFWGYLSFSIQCAGKSYNFYTVVR